MSAVTGVAPVKAEYLVKKPTAPAAEGADVSSVAPAANAPAAASADVAGDAAGGQPVNVDKDAAASRDGGGQEQKKRQRGMNKKRGVYRPDKGPKMCNAILAGRECKFGSSCKFSHDISAAAATRPPDLGPTLRLDCPVEAAFGRCRFGVTCRLSASHRFDAKVEAKCEAVPEPAAQAASEAAVTADCSGGGDACGGNGDGGKAAESDVAVEAAAPAARRLDEVEVNVAGRDLLQKLRKHQYDFSRANEVGKRVSADVLRWQQAKEGGSRRHAEQQAAAEAGEVGTTAAAESPANGAAESLAHGTEESLGKSAEEAGLEEGETHGAEAGAEGQAQKKRRLGEAAAESQVAAAAAPAAAGGTPLAASASAASAVEAAAGAAVRADDVLPLKREKRTVDFRGKLYLAPLTTVGNLPFRRICKEYGADITCGEMAMATNLLQAQASEWALLRRHPCEDVFGVQLAGNSVESLGRCAQLLEERLEVDFVDINMGCPIDIVCNRSCGAGLALKPNRVQGIVRTMSELLSCPLTCKMRTGYEANNPTAHKLISRMKDWGAAAVTLHGRSRQQRYTKLADWSYISQCSSVSEVPLIGNGDVFSYEDLKSAMGMAGGVASVMVARGALVKPWIFTELKEHRHWDISSNERLEMLRTFTKHGLEHWGSDETGVSRTRNFMLEWLSFLYRYVPLGLLERLPPKIQERPPAFFGRNELETLMASPNCADWVKITELLLGPVPDNFHFIPKHKSNAYSSENAPISSEG